MEYKEALLYEQLDGGEVVCDLCGHHCRLAGDRTGVCRVRKNIGGRLVSLNYHKVAATNADPIEKKPLYHFLPASTSFSVATMGCNFKCTFCQNHSLSVVQSEASIYGEPVSPEALVRTALRYDSDSISYTYSEPTIYFELMLETAKLAKEAGIKNCMVTNGFMSPRALELIAPYMDAANIDLKAFSESFYRERCGGRLEPVLDTIRGMKEKGIWVELTTLLIPGLNDDREELEGLIGFIVGVDAGMPWHVSRFFPQHRLVDIVPTPPGSIFDILERGKEMGLGYVYAGNVADDRFAHTYCPQCDELLIERMGYSTRVRRLVDGACGKCSHFIPGVWK